jgi:hypothetical protein
VAALTSLAVTCALHAQTASTCPEWQLVVNVRDANGKFIADLPPSAFVIKAHGESIPIKKVSAEPVPHRVILMLDASGSMTSNAHTWGITRLIAGDILAAAGSTHGVAMIVFGGKVQQTLDFSHSGSEILQWLRQHQDPETIIPKGERTTALFDSILFAANLFGAPMPGDAIYLVTDGGDNHSDHHSSEVQEVLRAKGVRFFSFLLFGKFVPTEEELLGPPLMKELSDATGGVTLNVMDTTLNGSYDLSPKGREKLTESLAYLYDLISRFYQVEVEMPAKFDKKQRLSIEIANKKGSKRKDVRVWYPNYLAPCTAP